MNINNNLSKISQPDFFTNDFKLLPFQLNTVYKMEELEKKEVIFNNNNVIETYNIDTGILGNSVGTGKSICILTLCKRNKYKIENIKNKMVIFNKDNYCKINIKDNNTDHLNTTLLVINHHLISFWENEIKKIKDFKSHTIKTKLNINLDINNINNYDLILCSSNLYNKFIKEYHMIKWNRVIFDDADSLKSINVKPNYRFIWFITSLYNNLFNNNNYHNNSFIKQYFKNNNFQNVDIFQNIAIIKYNIDHTTYTKNIIKCNLPIYNYLIHDYIPYYIQILIDNNEIGTAILHLGGEYYTKCDILKLFEDNKNIIHNINNIHNNTCSICLDEYNYPFLLECCFNMFCFKCLMTLLENTDRCPICRDTIKFENIILIDIESDTDTNEKNNITTLKEIECCNILSKNITKKNLIYYNNTNLDIIMNIKYILEEEDINFYDLKGNINNIINKYNNNNNIINKYNNNNNLFINYDDNKYRGIQFENINNIIILFDYSKYHNFENNIINRCFNINNKNKNNINIYYLET
jgi:hypothetical protein